MPKQRNLIWIITDSVRTFCTGLDDRDRLDFMDEFGEESVEFLKAFASAPSSILSGAAMFTGMPSVFVARHFSDWQFDPKFLISIQEILAGEGYTTYAIHNSKEDREVMCDLIHPISPKYFPGGVSHGEWWTNHQMNMILENVLRNGAQHPAFFMLWYDCRRDPLTSEMVKEGVGLFKRYGLYEDSLMVLNSDHGYPDPKSGLTESTMRGKRHDMVVTDDNIQVPLFVKYPGCRPRKVPDMVGLIDLFPTLLHLLDISCDDPRVAYVEGYDLVPLLEGQSAPWPEERIIRVDTRLSLAPGRVTALRTNTHKYVYYHDENAESLYDLAADPLELNDLLLSPTVENEQLRQRFWDKYCQMQDELNLFHIEELRAAFEQNIRKIKNKKINSLLFVSTAPAVFLEVIAKEFRNTFQRSKIDFLMPHNRTQVEDVSALFDELVPIESLEPAIARNALQNSEISKYDVTLLITEQSSLGFDNPTVYKVAKILGRKVLLVDFNMKFYNRFISQWIAPARKYTRNAIFYKQEPSLIIKDIVKLIRRGVKYLVVKQRGDTPDMEKAKLMRDRAMLAQKEAVVTKNK